MKSIKDILNSYNYNGSRNSKSFGSSPVQECFDFLSLVRQWKIIVGDKLAERTMPQGIYREQLVILTNHPAFAEQMSFMEKALLEKVFKAFPSLNGKLKKITFKYDSRKFDQQLEMLDKITKKTEIAKVIHPLSPQYRELRKKALQLFDHVEDEQTREQFISIYIQAEVDKH